MKCRGYFFLGLALLALGGFRQFYDPQPDFGRYQCEAMVFEHFRGLSGAGRFAVEMCRDPEMIALTEAIHKQIGSVAAAKVAAAANRRSMLSAFFTLALAGAGLGFLAMSLRSYRKRHKG